MLLGFRCRQRGIESLGKPRLSASHGVAMEGTPCPHLIQTFLHKNEGLLGTLKITVPDRVEELARRCLDHGLAGAIPRPITLVLFDSFLSRSRIRHVALSVR